MEQSTSGQRPSGQRPLMPMRPNIETITTIIQQMYDEELCYQNEVMKYYPQLTPEIIVNFNHIAHLYDELIEVAVRIDKHSIPLPTNTY